MKKTGKLKATKNKKVKASRAKAASKRFTIGLSAFEKVSAVEGLRLSREMKKTFASLERRRATPAQRRAALIKKYGNIRALCF
jgi:hypothetical protein